MAIDTTNNLKHDFIINKLISNNAYRSYLEIGVQYKANWDLIKCPNMVGVEPVGDLNDPRIIKTTSDDFFKTNNQHFDLIFVDGDHVAAAVAKDLENSCKWLSEGGTIVLHDAFPPDASFTAQYLCGTVYQAVWQFRKKGGFKVLTYSGDFGVCLLKRDSSIAPTIHSPGSYESYVQNATEIINLKRSDVEFLAALDAF